MDIIEKYKGTHFVARIKRGDEEAIFKRPKALLSSLALAYYWAQDAVYQGSREFCGARTAIREEIGKLSTLNDTARVPRVISSNYPKGEIVREYIPGKDWRSLTREEKEPCLESAIETVAGIHEAGVVIGSGHVKNVVWTPDEEAYWIDFDGLFDEDPRELAQARDLLQLLHSTYATADEALALQGAEWLKANYPHRTQLEALKSLLTLDRSLLQWFGSRAPTDLDKNLLERLN